MSLVKKMLLTPSQARELVRLGFILEIVTFMCREHDLYRVYVRN